MTKTMKAILLTALIFPGAGHLLLQRYRRGSLFILSAAIALYYLFSTILTVTKEVLVELELSRNNIDLDAINTLVNTQLASVTDTDLVISCAVLVVLWLAAIIDIIRISNDDY